MNVTHPFSFHKIKRKRMGEEAIISDFVDEDMFSKIVNLLPVLLGDITMKWSFSGIIFVLLYVNLINKLKRVFYS